MKLSLPNNRHLDIRRVVIKLGTKQITDTKTINDAHIAQLTAQIVELRSKGVECILVASGAIGLARYHMQLAGQKFTLSQKQALAGVGQRLLMSFLSEKFNQYQIWAGQVLLTHYIFDNRKTYLNARNTLNTMLEMGFIPVINENDSVATEEIQFGDNDRLGAYVSVMVGADLYIMLTDIDGLYADYGTPNQSLIKIVENIGGVAPHAQKQQENFTKGGMITKIQAARITTTAGVPAVIANGFRPNVLTEVLSDLSTGTIFLPAARTINHRKKWISSKRVKGKLVIDAGAANAVLAHKSLLATGIVAIEGSFDEGDTVMLYNQAMQEIGLGIVNYDAKEIQIIKGQHSDNIATLLGKNKTNTVIHCDNMVLYDTGTQGEKP